jgi:hypothetical protein
MPPATVKTVGDVLYWQYAKIIAASAGFRKEDYGFVTAKFKQLKNGEISWNQIREYIKERQTNECIYCGAEADLTLEHLLPRKFHGPQTERNLVWVCKSCNSAKGGKRLFEFWIDKYGLKEGKNLVPRIAEGKYLKFAYEVFERQGLLGMDITAVTLQACPECDLKPKCIREHTEGKLSVLCIDGILTLTYKQKEV